MENEIIIHLVYLKISLISIRRRFSTNNARNNRTYTAKQTTSPIFKSHNYSDVAEAEDSTAEDSAAEDSAAARRAFSSASLINES
jgi:hypothetical protein